MLRGFLYAIIAACTFGLIPLFSVPIMQSGLNVSSILFFRFGFSAIIIMCMALAKGYTLRICFKDFARFLCIGFCYGLSAITFFWAFNYMDTGIVATVQYCYPLFVVLIMVFFFGERFRPSTLMASLLICLGVAVFSLQDTSKVEVNLIGMTLTIFSAVQMALYVAGIQIFKFEVKNSMLISLYIMVSGTIFASLASIYEGGLSLPNSYLQWKNLILLTCITGVISTSALVRAVQYIGPSLASILGGLEPVTAMLVGIWVFSEICTLWNVVGALCIVGGVTLVAVCAHRRGSIN